MSEKKKRLTATVKPALEPEPSSALALATVPPLERCAVSSYLSALAPASQRRMGFALAYAAKLLFDRERIDARTVPWGSLALPHLQLLRAKLRDSRGLSTANLTLSAVRGVLRAAVTLNVHGPYTLAALTVRDIPGTKATVGVRLEPSEVRDLLACCDQTPRGRRNAFILAALYYTGARSIELVRLCVEDLLENATLLRLTGKGNHQRIVPLARNLRGYLDQYLAHRGTYPGPLLWRVERNHYLATCTSCNVFVVGRVVRTCAHLIESHHIQPHDFRRTFISELLERGVDLVRVQKLVGHADPETTSRYDRRELSKAASAVELLPLLEPQ